MKWVGIAVAVVAAALSGAATSQTRPDKNPDWLKRPSSENLMQFYPPDALKQGLSGSARIDCKLSVDGALFDCHVGSETPPGHGFGQAALALAPQFLMTPAIKDGHPVIREVKIPVDFKATGPYIGPMDTQTVLTIAGWLAAPTYDETVAAYPRKARESRTSGRVTLDCEIKADGHLNRCDPLAEEPLGKGFGSAAKGLADQFRAPLTLADGRSTRGMAVTLPFTFDTDMLDGGRRIGKPVWIHLPSGSEFDAAFPKPAQALTVRIMMDCAVTAGGRLADCRVESETPAGQGYGAAAVALAGSFSLAMWTVEGLPVVGGRVQVPIRYQIQ